MFTRRSALMLLSLSLLLGQTCFAARRTITRSQAKGLVLAALSTSQKRLPGLSADEYQYPSSPGFWFFTVTWAANSGQSVVVGNYAVDPNTGDVWSATISCDELRNRALEALQDRVRKSIGLSKAEYERLKTKGPLC